MYVAFTVVALTAPSAALPGMKRRRAKFEASFADPAAPSVILVMGPPDICPLELTR